MQFFAIFGDGIDSFLRNPSLAQQIHLVLALAGRFVLTVAASLFVVYVAFMGTALLVSLVRDGARALLHPDERLASVGAGARSVRVLAEQS